MLCKYDLMSKNHQQTVNIAFVLLQVSCKPKQTSGLFLKHIDKKMNPMIAVKFFILCTILKYLLIISKQRISFF